MRYYILYDKATGEILLRVKGTGPATSDSIELSEDQATAHPPLEQTHDVDPATKRLRKKKNAKEPGL